MPDQAKATEPVFLTVFEDVLGLVSAPTRIEFLDYEQKWRLLIQVLLGHPPIRGGNRPRDFPVGHHHERALLLANTLCEARVGYHSGKQIRMQANGTYSLYDWCVAFSLLSLGEEDQNGFRFRIRIALEKLRDVLFTSEEDRRDFFDRTNLLLGLRFPETEHVKPHTSLFKNIEKLSDMSAIAAMLTSICTPEKSGEGDLLDLASSAKCMRIFDLISPDPPDNPHRSYKQKSYLEILGELAQQRLWLISIKGKKIQSLLDQCKLSYIRRGASAWCSQSLAMLRDELLKTPLPEHPPMLLSDSDAVVTLVTSDPVDATTVVKMTGEIISRSVQSDGSLAARYPKLKMWRDQAENELVHNGVDAPAPVLARVYPDIAVQVQETNLLEMSLDCQRWFQGYKYLISSAAKEQIGVFQDREPAGAEEPGCSGLLNASPYRDEAFWVPPWYDHHKERFSWEAIAYSMAGSVYRMTVDRGLADEVENICGHINVRKLWNQRCQELLDAKVIESPRMSLVHIDGDSVGRLFIETPSLSRPKYGIGLESSLRARFAGAVRALVAMKSLPILPTDLLYLGGDDLMLRLPTDLFADFAEAFSKGPPTPDDAGCALDRLPGLTFTLVSIDYEPDSRPDRSKPKPPEKILHAMRRMSPLMRLAKGAGDKKSTQREVVKLDKKLADGSTLVDPCLVKFEGSVSGMTFSLASAAED